MVLLYMAGGEIDLAMLLSESKGTDAQGNPLYGASMSRFQLLIFTVVIALSLLMIIIANGATKFPAVPSEILVLLGISASTYAVGKGIQSSGTGSGGNGGGTAGGTSTSGGGSAATASHPAPTRGRGKYAGGTMPPQEPSTASGSPPGTPAGAGTPPGGAASQPVSQTWKGTVARGMSVAPLALAVLAQVGVIG